MACLERKIGLNPARSEMAVLVSQYGKTQVRCSRLIAEQAALIEALQAEQMRLRAELVIRVTALQFEREERARLEAMAPGLPRRAILARQVDQLKVRLEALLRERTAWRWGGERRRETSPRRLSDNEGVGGHPDTVGTASPPMPADCCSAPAWSLAPQTSGGSSEAIQQSLLEAELLICRTGCISHGDYWRVQDHCRRTGKPCLLIDEHHAIHVVRQGDSVVVQARAVHPLEK